MINDNKKIRIFPIKRGIKVRFAFQDPNDLHNYSLATWRKNFMANPDKLDGMSDAWALAIQTKANGYWITIKNHQVIAIKNFWTP